MKTRARIFQKMLPVILAFTVLILMEGCMTYNIATRSPDSESIYKTYIRQGKYFILVTPRGKCHLADVRVADSTLYGTVAPIDEPYLMYLHVDPDTVTVTGIEHRDRTLENLVFIHTLATIPDTAKTLVIPIRRIDHVQAYKWQATSATIGVVSSAALIGLLLVNGEGDAGDIIQILFGGD